MAILTIDVGQKFVRYGFFDDEGNLTEKGKYQVPRESAQSFYKSIANLVTENNTKLKQLVSVFLALLM